MEKVFYIQDKAESIAAMHRKMEAYLNKDTDGLSRMNIDVDINCSDVARNQYSGYVTLLQIIQCIWINDS